MKVIKVSIDKGEKMYVAKCVDIPVVTQGIDINECINNIREAVSLFLEDEDLEEWGLEKNPSLFISIEIGLQDVA